MDNADKTREQLLAELAELRDDVSERSQSRARVFESVRAIIIEMDAGGRFTYVSPTVTGVLGYLPDEVYSTQDRNFLHTDDREPLAELLRKITSSGQAASTGRPVGLMPRRSTIWVPTSTSSFLLRSAPNTRSV